MSRVVKTDLTRRIVALFRVESLAITLPDSTIAL